MDPVIHQMNARSWETLVLSMLKVDLLSNVSTTMQIEIYLTGRNKTMMLLNKQWDETLLKENNKVSAEEE